MEAEGKKMVGVSKIRMAHGTLFCIVLLLQYSQLWQNGRIQRLEVICKSKMNVSFPVPNEALDFEKFVTSQPRFEANVIRHILPLRKRGWYKSGFDHGSFLFIRSCRGKFFKGRQHHIFGSHSVATGKLALRTDLSLSASFSCEAIWERESMESVRDLSSSNIHEEPLFLSGIHLACFPLEVLMIIGKVANGLKS